MDAINWFGLKGIADSAIAAGQGSTLIAIRDAGDETFEASANVVAEDQAALDAIDIEAGWPD